LEFQDFVDYIQTLQSSILTEAERMDGSGRRFVRDQWQRDAQDANAGERERRSG
jgi:coproporphyrinogen III oxidase